MENIEENDHQIQSELSRGVNKATKFGCILFMIFMVIAIGAFLVVAFFNSLFDRNRMVGSHYKMSSGVSGSARAIEFPFAIRGKTIRSITISSDDDTDFYVRTKSGDILLNYEKKVVTHFLGKYNTRNKYFIGLGVLPNTSDPLYFQSLDDLITDPKTFEIHNPSEVRLYMLDSGSVSDEDYKKMRGNPIEISVDGKTWYDFPVSLKNAQKMFGEIVEIEDYTGKGI